MASPEHNPLTRFVSPLARAAGARAGAYWAHSISFTMRADRNKHACASASALVNINTISPRMKDVLALFIVHRRPASLQQALDLFLTCSEEHITIYHPACDKRRANFVHVAAFIDLVTG